MQVFFAAPPVVASPDSPIAADLPLSEAAPADGSFASLLDSNSPPSAAPAASKPAAASSQAPESPEEAEVAELVADDQGEAAEADEETVIDAWLATAVEAAIPMPTPPVVAPPQSPSAEQASAFPDSSGESTPVVNTDVPLAESAWPEIDAAPFSVGGSDTEKAVQPKIAAGRGAAHRRESTGGSADAAEAPMTAEVSPAVSPDNRSLRREERLVVGGGAVPAQEADIPGGTASGLQMQESVSVAWAARGSGKVTDVESEGGAVAWADPAHPVTTDARAVGAPLVRQALEGDGGAKPVNPGIRVPVRPSDGSPEIAALPENRPQWRQARPVVGGDAVPAQEADILGGTASGLQMQESVSVAGAALLHPVTTDARAVAASNPAVRQAVDGDGGAKFAYPGPRVPIQLSDGSSEMAASSMSDDGGQTAPATSPVVAAPTLAQVLVEGSQSRVPRSGSAKVTALTASSEANVSDAVAGDASSQETEPDAVGIPAQSAGGTEAEKTVAPASRRPRENLAVTSGKSLKVAAKDAMGTLRRNFQNVEQKVVGDAGGFVGTGTAKDAEAMVAHTQVLPTTASSAHDAGEAVPALTGVASGASATVSGRHVAEPSTGNTAAADAVRETLEAAERAQQTGRNNVELRLQTSGDESLRVHLRLQDGVVHAKFVTQSTELQQALSREWDLLAPRLAEKGIKFGETSFENRDQSGQSTAQNAFTSGQQRHHTHDQGQAYQQAEERAFTLASPTATTTAASRRSPVTASASVAAPASLNTAEARGLRVWA